MWVYENHDSTAPERPVCRSLDCYNQILKMEDSIRKAIDSQDFHVVDKVLSGLNVDIDVRLKNEAEIAHEKLKRELDIR